jgi:hypothetical protein
MTPRKRKSRVYWREAPEPDADQRKSMTQLARTSSRRQPAPARLLLRTLLTQAHDEPQPAGAVATPSCIEDHLVDIPELTRGSGKVSFTGQERIA